MTPEQIDLVQQSLPAIRALGDRAPASLHEQLVVLDPPMRPLFAGADMRRQGALLIGAVAATTQAPQPDSLDSAATALRQYHLNFGIEAYHFQRAGGALAQALEQELGSNFTTEMGQAWASACEWVGRAVLEAQHPFAA